MTTTDRLEGTDSAWFRKKLYAGQVERTSPPTPLELDAAYRAGVASYKRQEACPYGRLHRPDPTGLLAAQWERGREVMRRLDAPRRGWLEGA
jgi:hypothetical protein